MERERQTRDPSRHNTTGTSKDISDMEVSNLCHPKVNSTDHTKEEYGTQATDEGPLQTQHHRHFQGYFGHGRCPTFATPR